MFFLTNILNERGFPPKWISSVLTVLQTSSSAIRANGMLSRFFLHKRGLRQGDPLSPMLFILVANALQQFIRNAIPIMPPHAFLPPEVIQYANDTVIIAKANPTTWRIIIAILRDFSKLTGLKINQSKNSFVPMAIPQPHPCGRGYPIITPGTSSNHIPGSTANNQQTKENPLPTNAGGNAK